MQSDGPRSLLFVTTVSTTARAFLLPYAEEMRRKGWRVELLAAGAPDCGDCVRTFDATHDIHWSRSPFDVLRLGVSLRKVRQVFDAGRYDVVHVHTPIAAFVTRLALRDRRAVVMYTAHGFHFHERGGLLANWVFRSLERLAGRWTDYLLVINAEDHAAARELRIVAPGRLFRLNGIGVDLESLTASSVSEEAIAEVRRECGVADGQVMFAVVAELSARKRPLDVLEAAAAIRERNCCVVFVGTGPLEEELRREVTARGLESRVKVLGFRRDVGVLIRASRATVLSSSQEGLPRSIMESMALEVPFIATEIRGTRELLASGGGIGFAVGDVVALRKHMEFMTDSPRVAVEMGRKGRAALEPYALSSLVAFHAELYDAARSERW